MAAVIGALRADLSASIAQFERDMGRASRAVKTFSADAERASRRLENAGRAMTLAITAPVAAIAFHMGRAAIEAEEMQSAFNVSFGSMADSTRRWAETTGDALGRSTYEIQAAALAFNGLFKAGGPATEQAADLARQFAVLAQDLSSFHNVSPEDALMRLRSGLSGEAEPLRRFNVYLTEATVQQRALAMGLARTTAEISEQDKIMARASLIMEGTAEAQGDVIRTQDSAQNRIREANANWQELSVTLGTRFIPIIGAVAEKLGDLVEKFGQLNPEVQNAIMIFAGAAAVLGPLLLVAGAFAGAVSQIAAAWGTASTIFANAMASAGVTSFTVALRALIAAFAPWLGLIVAVVAACWQFRGAFEESFGYLAEHFQSAILPALQNLGAALQELFGSIGELLTTGPLGELVRFVAWAVAEISALLLQGLGHAILATVGFVIDMVATIVRAISDLVEIVSALIRGDWAGAWEAAQSLAVNAITGIWGALDNFVPGFSDAMRSIHSAAQEWLGERLAALLNWIEERFPGIAEAVRQAAAGAIAWARNLYQGVRTWIADNLGPVITWAQNRIRDLNRLFGWIRRRQAETSGSRAPAAPAAEPPPASGGGAAPAPSAPPPPAGGGGGGGGGRGGSGSDRSAENMRRAAENLRESLEDVQGEIDQAFNRRQLPRAMEAAEGLRDRLAEIEEEARAAGIGADSFAGEIADLQAQIAELEIEGLVEEAVEFGRRTRELQDEVRALGGDIGPLAERLAQLDGRHEQLRQTIVEEIEANRVLADSNDDAAAAMAVLEGQLEALDAAHRRATESARLLFEAEEHLADLQAAREAGDIERAIGDLRRSRGEDAPVSRRLQALREIEEQLADQRTTAAIELAAMERERLAALAAGDEAQATRLAGLIGLQTQLLALVEDTTAEQIHAAERIADAFDEFVGSLSDKLADMVMEWEFDLQGVRDIFKQLARQLFIQPVTDAFSAGIGNLLKGFAGGFATGGSIPAGQWGIVGEHGPEPVFAGASRMTVFPNDSLRSGRGGRGDVIFNVSTPDADSFRASERQLARRAKQALGADR